MPPYDGGPAFPGTEFYDERPIGACEGMSLRDYFAGQALAAFTRGFDQEHTHSNPGNTPTIAQKCYQMADALLEARKRAR